MQRITSWSALLIVVALCFGLTACSSGSDKPVRIYPVIGKNNGVVKTNTRNGPGQANAYNCAAGLTTVTVSYLNGSDYNGTYLLGEEQANQTPPHHYQLFYFVDFAGDIQSLAGKAISMIVSSQANENTTSGDVYVPDDRVVNLEPNMFVTGTMQLNTIDYTQSILDSYITDVRFCLKP